MADMQYKWLHDLFFEESDRWEPWQVSAVRKAFAFIAGFVVVVLLLSALLKEEPQPKKEQRPWKEILSPEQRGHRPQNTRPTKGTATPPASSEDKLIDKLSRGDYYDHADYNGGLSGEHADMDYAEVDNYFRD